MPRWLMLRNLSRFMLFGVLATTLVACGGSSGGSTLVGEDPNAGQPPPPPPELVLSLSGVQSPVESGDSVSFVVNAADATGDVSYSVSSGPVGMNVSSEGAVTWSAPSLAFVNSQTFSFTIAGATSDQTATVSGSIVVTEEGLKVVTRAPIKAPRKENGIFVADFDNDNANEILITDHVRMIYTLEWDANQQRYVQDWVFPYLVSGTNTIEAIYPADLNADGKLDIVVANGPNISIIDGDTRSVSATLTTGFDLIKVVKSADLEADGRMEIIAIAEAADPGTGDQQETVLAFDPESLAIVFQSQAGNYGDDLELANVDADDQLEIVTAGGSVIDGISKVVEWNNVDGFGDLITVGNFNNDDFLEVAGLSDPDGNSIINVYSPFLKSALFSVLDVDDAPNPEMSQCGISARNITGSEANELVVSLCGASGNAGLLFHDLSAGVDDIASSFYSSSANDDGVRSLVFGDSDNDGSMNVLWMNSIDSSDPDVLTVASINDGIVTVDVYENTLGRGENFYAGAYGVDRGFESLAVFSTNVTDDNGSIAGRFQSINLDTFEVSVLDTDPANNLGSSSTTLPAQSFTLADVDGDGFNEALVSSAVTADGVDTGAILTVEFGSDEVTLETTTISGAAHGPVASGFITSDTFPDVVTFADRFIVAFDHEGTQLWRSVEVDSDPVDVQMVDVDSDGVEDLLVLTENRLYLYSRNESIESVDAQFYEDLFLESSFIQTAATSNEQYTALESGDFDGDGTIEILVSKLEDANSTQPSTIVSMYDQDLVIRGNFALSGNVSDLLIEGSDNTEKLLISAMDLVDEGGNVETKVIALDPFTGSENWRSPSLLGMIASNSMHYFYDEEKDLRLLLLGTEDAMYVIPTEGELTISEPPTPLSVAVPGLPSTISSGSFLNFSVQALGGQGTISYSLDSAPVGMSIDNSGQVTWNVPDLVFVNSQRFDFTVTANGLNESASANGSIVVTDDGIKAVARSALQVPAAEHMMHVADFDGDLVNEILATDNENLIYTLQWNPLSESYEQDWLYPYAATSTESIVAIAPLYSNFDPVLDIAVVSQSTVAIIDGATRSISTSRQLDGMTILAMAVGYPYDNSEIVLIAENGSGDQSVMALNANSLDTVWQSDTGNYGSAILMVNTDDDLALEIVTSGGTVFDSATRAVDWNNIDGFGDVMVAGNFNSDPYLEIAGITNPGSGSIMEVFSPFFRSALFSVLDRVDSPNPEMSQCSMAANDFTGDNIDELVVGLCNGSAANVGVFIYDLSQGRGDVITRFYRTNDEDAGVRSLAIGDSDSDGIEEVFWVNEAQGTGIANSLTVASVTLDDETQSLEVAIDYQELALALPSNFFAGAYGVETQFEEFALFSTNVTDSDGAIGGRLISLNLNTLELSRLDNDPLNNLGSSSSPTPANSFSLADIDGDGSVEAVVSTTVEIDGIGSVVSFQSAEIDGTVINNAFSIVGGSNGPIDTGLITSDGLPDYIGFSNRFIYAFSNSGTRLWTSIEVDSDPITIDMSDVDGNGTDDMLALTQNRLYYYRRNDAIDFVADDFYDDLFLVAAIEETESNERYTALASGDFDGDGDIEIVSARLQTTAPAEPVSLLSVYDDQMNLTRSFTVDGIVDDLEIAESSDTQKLLIMALQDGNGSSESDTFIVGFNISSGFEVWRSPALLGEISTDGMHFYSDLEDDLRLLLAATSDAMYVVPIEGELVITDPPAPLTLSLPNIPAQISSGEDLAFALNSSGGSGTTLFTLESGPVGMSVDANGNVSWTPPPLVFVNSQTVEFEITASNEAQSVSVSGSVTVTDEGLKAVARSPLRAPTSENAIHIGDFDGDGANEILATDNESLVYTLQWNGDTQSYEQEWLYPFSATVNDPIVAIDVADFDDDGILDIAISGGDTLALVDGESRNVLLSAETGLGIVQAMAVADIEDDGDVEVVVIYEGDSGLDTVAVFSSTDLTLEWQSDEGNYGDELILANTDNDSALEIITSGGSVFDGLSKLVEWDNIDGFGDVMVVGNFNDDPYLELAGISNPGTGSIIEVFSPFFRSALFSILDIVDTPNPEMGQCSLAAENLVGGDEDELIVGLCNGGADNVGVLVYDLSQGSEQIADSLYRSNSADAGVLSLTVGDADNDGVQDLVWMNASSGDSFPDSLTTAAYLAGSLAIQHQDLTLALPENFFAGAYGFNFGADALALYSTNVRDDDGSLGGRLMSINLSTFELSTIDTDPEKNIGASSTFAPASSFAVADMDDDGFAEALVSSIVNVDGTEAAAFLVTEIGSGLISQSSPTIVGAANGPVDTGLITSDDQPDYIGFSNRFITAFSNDGTRLWRSIEADSNPLDIQMVDIDSDGVQDLLAMTRNRLYYYRRNDAISFVDDSFYDDLFLVSALLETGSNEEYTAMESGDFDGDGDIEIVTAKLENTTADTPVSIISVYDASMIERDRFTIPGKVLDMLIEKSSGSSSRLILAMQNGENSNLTDTFISAFDLTTQQEVWRSPTILGEILPESMHYYVDEQTGLYALLIASESAMYIVPTEGELIPTDPPSPLSLATSAIPDSVNSGSTVNFTLQASGGTGTYSYSYVTGPNGLTLDASGLVTWIPSDLAFVDTQTTQLVFDVSDGANVVTLVVDVTIRDDGRFSTVRSGLSAPQRNNAVFIDDFDGDGNNEILVTDNINRIYTLENGVDGYFMDWMYPFVLGEGGNIGGIAPGDFNDDGDIDIAVANGSYVSIIDGDTRLASLSVDTDLGNAVAVAAADINGSGTEEIVALFVDPVDGLGTFAVYTADDLTLLWTSSKEDFGESIGVGNVDSDSALEIVAGGGFVFDGSSFDLEWENIDSFGDIISLGDFDNDGRKEVAGIKGTEGDISIIEVYSPNQQAGLFSILNPAFDPEPQMRQCSIISPNIDGDVEEELLVGFCNDAEGGVAVISYDLSSGAATTIDSFVRDNEEDAGAISLAVGDPDGDGIDNIIWFSQGAETPSPDSLYVTEVDLPSTPTVHDTQLGLPQSAFTGAYDAATSEGQRAVFGTTIEDETTAVAGRLVTWDYASNTISRLDNSDQNNIGTSGEFTPVEHLSVADVDNDGIDEAIVSNVVDGGGTEFATFQSVEIAEGTVNFFAGGLLGAQNGPVDTGIITSGDTIPDFAGFSGQFLRAFDSTSFNLWLSIQLVGDPQDIQLYDIDSDGIEDLLAVTDQRLYFYTRNTDIEFVGSEFYDELFLAVNVIEREDSVQSYTSVESADFDADGTVDIIAGKIMDTSAAEKTSQLEIYSPDGELQRNIPIDGEVLDILADQDNGGDRLVIVALRESDATETAVAQSRVIAYNFDNGAEVWRSPLLVGSVAPDSMHFASDGRLLVGTEDAMYVVE